MEGDFVKAYHLMETIAEPNVLLVQNPQLFVWYTIIEQTQRCVFVIAFLFSFYFVYRVSKMVTIHPNFRIVLCTAAISFQWMGATHFFMTELYSHTQHIDNRYLLNITSIIICHTHMISVASSALCMNMLAIEQHLAALWVDTYEGQTRRIGLILIGIVFAQSVPLGILTTLVTVKDFDLSTTKETCMPTDLSAPLNVLMFGIGDISCTLAAVWIIHIRRLNRRKTKSRLSLQTLSARFQQTNNSNTSSSITPSMIGYMLTAILGTILEACRWYLAPSYHSIPAKLIINVKYILLDGFAIFHMFCFLLCSNTAKSAIFADLAALFCVSAPSRRNLHRVGSVNEDNDKMTATYFRQLQSAWN